MPSNLLESFTQWTRSLAKLMKENYRSWTCFWLLSAAYVALEFGTTPYVRRISPDSWDSLKYPYKDPATVPSAWMPIVSVALPIVVVTLYHAISRCEMREYHDLLFSIVMNVAVTGFTTTALKNGLGRPRPDFYERCFGDPFNEMSELSYLRSYDKIDCPSNDSHRVNDGRKSFPSGHASWAMCSMFYLTLFFVGKLRAFDGRGQTWKWVLSLLPIGVAIAIGITRINDYRHHWTDVVAGWLLGMMFATVMYLTYYPWPFARSGTETPLHKNHWQELSQDSFHPINADDDTIEEGRPLRAAGQLNNVLV